MICGCAFLLATVACGYQFTLQIEQRETMLRIDNVARNLLISLLDSETGERGFIITNNEAYLVPYQAGSISALQRLTFLETRLRSLPSFNSDHLHQAVHQRLNEMSSTIDIARQRGFEAAKIEVNTHIGKNSMDTVREDIDAIELLSIQNTKTASENATFYARGLFLSGFLTLSCLGLLLLKVVRK